MESDIMGIGTPINQEDMKEMSKESKETVAADAKQVDVIRSFGAIDMWNRQKRQRTALHMRRWLN